MVKKALSKVNIGKIYSSIFQNIQYKKIKVIKKDQFFIPRKLFQKISKKLKIPINIVFYVC